MTDVTYIAPTPRKRMTRARAAKIFLREQGRCYVCSRQLRAGIDKYQIEHPDPLCLGGSDNDSDLRVICDSCHKPKTAVDAKTKAKRDRLVTASWQQTERRSRLQSAGFAKSQPQRTASRPTRRKGI